MAQVRKKKKNLLLPILLAVLVLLAGVLFLTADKGSKEEKEVRPHLLSTSVEDIRWIEIVRPSGDNLAFSLAVEEQGNTLWKMTRPLHAAADQEKVNSLLEMVSKVVGIPVSSDSESESDLSQYGLDSASSVVIKIGSEDGVVLDEVHLGRILPLDVGYVYAALTGKPGILYKAQKQIKDIMTEEVNGYRGHKLIYQDPDSVTSLIISRDGYPEVELKKDGDWWDFVSDGNAPADDGKISEMLKSIGAAEITAYGVRPNDPFLFPGSSLVTYQLSGPEGSDTVSFPYPAGTRTIAAETDNDPEGVQLSNFRPETLVVDTHDLLHRGLLRFTPGDISQVIIEKSGTLTEIQKTGENEWKIVQPVEERAEPALVFRIFSVLVRYRLPDDAYVNDGSFVYSESPDDISFKLLEKNGTEHSIKIQPYKNSKVAVLSSFLEEPVFLDAEILENIPLEADDFIDKKLLHINPMALGAIEIKRSMAEDIRLEKFAKEWVVTDPERVAANTPLIWGMVFGFEKAEFLYRLSEDPVDMPEKTVRISLWDENKNQAGIITCYIPGSPSESTQLRNAGDIIVTSSNLSGFYAASKDILKDLPENYKDILYRE